MVMLPAFSAIRLFKLKPSEVIEIFPKSVAIVLEITLSPSDIMLIFPFWAEILLLIANSEFELFVISTAPVFSIKESITAKPVPFCVITICPTFSIFPLRFKLSPELTICIFPTAFVIAPDNDISPAVLETIILPFPFVIAFVISNPSVEDISTFPDVEFVTGALTFRLLPVFLIFMPSVEETDEVSEIVKLPFLFSISIFPS